MGEYSKECIKVFLEQQKKMFDEIVAETVREAKEVLTENMAVEVNSLEEVKEFLDENGMDIAGMSDEEILSQSEVFSMPSGRFLVLAG
ncbi:MAG: glyoxalase [Lachnospiraceae bacterium]|nr:glyoxalase [Lachnospiraceae bacterium]